MNNDQDKILQYINTSDPDSLWYYDVNKKKGDSLTQKQGCLKLAQFMKQHVLLRDILVYVYNDFVTNEFEPHF